MGVSPDQKDSTVKILHAIVSAGILGTGIALAGTANAAPTGPTNAEDLVMQLQADGNTVVVNRTGSRPLSQCLVTGVRSGQTSNEVTAMTFYVDANCQDGSGADKEAGRSVSRNRTGS